MHKSPSKIIIEFGLYTTGMTDFIVNTIIYLQSLTATAVHVTYLLEFCLLDCLFSFATMASKINNCIMIKIEIFGKVAKICLSKH